MNPAFLDAMSWEMAEVYGAITDQILINLSRYFPYYKAGHAPRSSFDYQVKMLAQMGKINRETVQIIRNGLQGADKALGNVLEQTIIDSIRKTEPGLLKAVQAGILKPAGIPVVAPSQMRAFSLYYQQAADKLNLVNTVMLESTKSAYQQTISDVVADIELAERVNATQIALDVGAGETITGVSSWNQATRHAIDRLKDRGITGFIDHAGRQWDAETYVAMDIRTTVYNTARSAVWEQNQDFGNDLYIVSYHDGARPLCYPWQNKVISSTDNARTVVDLDGNEMQVIAQSDTSYGEAAGLFGINCKHYPTPFIPGVSVAYDEGQIPSEKENAKIYENTQKQRGLERQLREQKRDLLMEKARGADRATLEPLRQKCRETSDQIDEFCKETGLPRRQNREGVFTQRDFPDADKYDVAAFERKQKEEIDKYFSGGGSQTGYTFGQMTPNEPLVPKPPENVASQATQTAQKDVQSQQLTFTPATTKAEAEQYTRDHFAKSVNYSGDTSLETLNAVNRELTELTEKYPIERLDTIRQNGRLKTSNARANGGLIEFKSGKLTEPGTYSVEKYRESAQRTIQSLETMFPNGIPASWRQSYNAAQEQLKFTRWSISSQYGSINATIPHEYGHVLADQRCGQINRGHYCKDYGSAEAAAKRALISDTFAKAKQTGDIYGISEYAKKNAYEFFAESFAAKWVGEQLPDYIEEMIERVVR